VSVVGSVSVRVSVRGSVCGSGIGVLHKCSKSNGPNEVDVVGSVTILR